MASTTERRRQASLASTEVALAIACPTCKTAPGIWCGPVLTSPPFTYITPWMHERRYRTTKEA